ncbi:cytochrome P450 [Streptomyces sp. enrichment culture]|uniref:cytochrome P450 n=1 Tax=Streptomyces sp. enrichment culture TaxID=1795815 RepID=UPI003F55C191
MSNTDRGLGRRRQLQQGLVWLAAAQGDDYAALLRGLDTDHRDHWSALRERPLSRSATGDWVTARHSVACVAGSEAALREHALLDEPGAFDDEVRSGDTPAWEDHAPTAWKRAVERAFCDRAEADLVAVARDAAVGTLARAWRLDETAERALRTALPQTRGALDAPFYPQSLARTRQIAGGLAAVRAIVPDHLSNDLVTAVAGTSAATDLVTNAVAQYFAHRDGPAALWDLLATRPGQAERVVRETLRLAPPLRLGAVTATTSCRLAGEHIAAGERVVTVVGAANRDPDVFADPDRFDPDRHEPGRAGEQPPAVLVPGTTRASVLPFAVACAVEGLLTLAAHRPRRSAAGLPVRHTAAPVSPSLSACAVVVAQGRRPGRVPRPGHDPDGTSTF